MTCRKGSGAPGDSVGDGRRSAFVTWHAIPLRSASKTAAAGEKVGRNQDPGESDLRECHSSPRGESFVHPDDSSNSLAVHRAVTIY